MKFTKVIGECSSELIEQAQEDLSVSLTELSFSFTNKSYASKLGGDPLIFQLVYPAKHICDASAIVFDTLEKASLPIYDKISNGITPSKDEFNILEQFEKIESTKNSILRTAATSGSAYYWNPEFVVNKTPIGRRILLCHEGHHNFCDHIGRRGTRNLKLWNQAVDFKVNHTIMNDLMARGVSNSEAMFREHLGDFVNLNDYAIFLKDPYNPPKSMDQYNPAHQLLKIIDPKYKDPGEYKKPLYFGDSSLPKEMKMPENIYDYLYQQIPKCKECGRIGKYKKPDYYLDLEKQAAKIIADQNNPKKKSWLSSIFGQ